VVVEEGIEGKEEGIVVVEEGIEGKEEGIVVVEEGIEGKEEGIVVVEEGIEGKEEGIVDVEHIPKGGCQPPSSPNFIAFTHGIITLSCEDNILSE
jgi:hypothetical protein